MLATDVSSRWNCLLIKMGVFQVCVYMHTSDCKSLQLPSLTDSIMVVSLRNIVEWVNNYLLIVFVLLAIQGMPCVIWDRPSPITYVVNALKFLSLYIDQMLKIKIPLPYCLLIVSSSIRSNT